MATAKILIVEDDQNLLATFKYNLLKESYDVITAVDGAQAIDTAQSSPCAFGNFCIIYRGKVIAYHPISPTRFTNIMNKELTS